MIKKSVFLVSLVAFFLIPDFLYAQEKNLFLLQSAENQDNFIWVEKDQKFNTNLITIPKNCLECVKNFLTFIDQVRFQYKTDFGIKALIATPVCRMATKMLNVVQVSNRNQKFFYFDPGFRLLKHVEADPNSKNSYFIIMKGTKVLAKSNIDLKSPGSINRFMGMLK